MSRGLGKVQRTVLKVLRAHPEMTLATPALCRLVEYPELTEDNPELAAMLTPRLPVSEARRVAVMRACWSLQRAGRIKAFDMPPGNLTGWRIADGG